ncbi:MAG: hypothetical protein ABMB14_29740, partial [Myxococcota bacterium]
GDHPWLPPDLSAQLPSGPVESPLPSGGIGLLHHARRDALRLRWLCWSLGLDEVAVPARVAVAPDRPSRALALVVIARAVQLQSGSPPTEAVIADWIRDEPPATVAAVHALLAEAIPTSTWFGLPLNDTGPAQRDFAFEDELALFKLLLTWWGEPNERTAFEAADADDDSDDSDDSDEDEE